MNIADTTISSLKIKTLLGLKEKGIKLSVLVDLQGLPLSIIVVPANKNDSTHYNLYLKIS